MLHCIFFASQLYLKKVNLRINIHSYKYQVSDGGGGGGHNPPPPEFWMGGWTPVNPPAFEKIFIREGVGSTEIDLTIYIEILAPCNPP